MEHTLLENLDEMDRMHQKHFGEETAKEFSEAITKLKLLLIVADEKVTAVAGFNPGDRLVLTTHYDMLLTDEEVFRMKEALRAVDAEGLILERMRLIGICEAKPQIKENEV